MSLEIKEKPTDNPKVTAEHLNSCCTNEAKNNLKQNDEDTTSKHIQYVQPLDPQLLNLKEVNKKYDHKKTKSSARLY